MKSKIFKKISCIVAFALLFGNDVLPQQRIAVIADTQSPIRIEMLWSDAERNVEATDTLFSRLLKEHVSAIFMLGDLVAVGNCDEDWVPVDYFTAALRRKGIGVYAIPGNHEYSFPAGAGNATFYKRFPRAREPVQLKINDSVAMVLLDANYGKLSRKQKDVQAERYQHCMDSLQNAPAVRAIIVCTHQSPYTNSTGVKPSKEVQERLIPAYIAKSKAVLFLSGHSHNMEWFRQQGKDFLVVGGGGGLKQPLLNPQKQRYNDLMSDDQRIRFFYIVIERKGNVLSVKAKGMQADDFAKKTEKEILKIEI